jgi:ABC-type transporter lipoprotein component MlaA
MSFSPVVMYPLSRAVRLPGKFCFGHVSDYLNSILNNVQRIHTPLNNWLSGLSVHVMGDLMRFHLNSLFMHETHVNRGLKSTELKIA